MKIKSMSFCWFAVAAALVVLASELSPLMTKLVIGDAF